MEGLPAAKAERVAAMRREIADLQRQLSEAQQRISTEVQARADDDEKFEALEARMQAQEQRAHQDAAKAAALADEIEGRRALLANLTSTAEELRRDIAARDAQLEEARRQHAAVTQELEAQRTSLEETKAVLNARDAELATRTGERDTAQTTISRLERELDAQSKQHRETAEQIERDAKALAATRATELGTVVTERDALKAELEKLRGELETGRAKAREIGNQLAKFGQEIGDAGIVSLHRERAQPPPPPPPRPSGTSLLPKNEPILELTPEPEPPKARTGMKVLMLIGGVIVGSAITFGIVKATSSSSAVAGNEADLGDPPPSALGVPAAQPSAQIEAVADPPPTIEPAMAAPAADPSANPAPKAETAPPVAAAEVKTDGVLLLPDEAAGHRLFIDGKKVDVNGSRAVVPCGTRAVQIGSRGVARTIEVACGGETVVPPDPK